MRGVKFFNTRVKDINTLFGLDTNRKLTELEASNFFEKKFLN